MSSIMRARNGLTGRSEVSEVIGALSRAEGCWTFDARDRMLRQSRATAHHLGENAPTATRTPSRERVRSSARLSPSPRDQRRSAIYTRSSHPRYVCGPDRRLWFKGDKTLRECMFSELSQIEDTVKSARNTREASFTD